MGTVSRILVRKPGQGESQCETNPWSCFDLKPSAHLRCAAPVSSCSRSACRYGTCCMKEISQASSRGGDSCTGTRNQSRITTAPLIAARNAASGSSRVVARFRTGQLELLFHPQLRTFCATPYSVARFRGWAEREPLDLDYLRDTQTCVQRERTVNPSGQCTKTYRDHAICLPLAARRAAACQGSGALYAISRPVSPRSLAGTTKVNTCREYLGHE